MCCFIFPSPNLGGANTLKMFSIPHGPQICSLGPQRVAGPAASCSMVAAACSGRPRLVALGVAGSAPLGPGSAPWGPWRVAGRPSPAAMVGPTCGLAGRLSPALRPGERRCSRRRLWPTVGLRPWRWRLLPVGRVRFRPVDGRSCALVAFVRAPEVASAVAVAIAPEAAAHGSGLGGVQ
jgi:hypothetical protein